MVCGIYCYRDLNNHGKIVYVGKDSNIDINKRDKGHRTPSNYNAQPFNRVLQNNPDRYEYQVLRTGDFNNNWLSALEIIYIKRYGTYDNRKGYGESYGFNFTIGGDGSRGYMWSEEQKAEHSKRMSGENAPWFGKKFSDEHKRKLSFSHKGKTPWIKGKDHTDEAKKKISEANKGKKHSDEFKQKIRERQLGKKRSEETKRKISESRKGIIYSNETLMRMSESHIKKYARIIKNGFSKGKQAYRIRKNGKYLKQSINPSKLLEWFTKQYPNEILQIKINMEE